MKIIGSAEGGDLIQASQNEVYKLLGCDMLDYRDKKDLTEEQLDFKKQKDQKRDMVGLTIPIAPMYAAARNLAIGIDTAYPVKDVIRMLEEMQDALKNIAAMYNLPKDDGAA